MNRIPASLPCLLSRRQRCCCSSFQSAGIAATTIGSSSLPLSSSSAHYVSLQYQQQQQQQHRKQSIRQRHWFAPDEEKQSKSHRHDDDDSGRNGNQRWNDDGRSSVERRRDAWHPEEHDNTRRTHSNRRPRGNDFDNNYQHHERPYRENYHDNNEPAPSVDRAPLTSITIAASKKEPGGMRRGGGGGGSSSAAKYCYGCGATIVKKSEQAFQTMEARSVNGSSLRDDDNDDGSCSSNHPNQRPRNNNISMGLKATSGSYWVQRKLEVQNSQLKHWGLCPRCQALQRSHRRDANPNEHHLQTLSPNHEMTTIFRDEVSKLRTKYNAVVVLCVDAVNPIGSMIRTLRNHVGGLPILLAVTRCDLLPDYVKERWTWEKKEGVKDFFRSMAKELNIADVYLCSVDDKDGDRDKYDRYFYGDDHGDEYRDEKNEKRLNEVFDGTHLLADDLLTHLDGRDPYVVGAANIGKSTLTDHLIHDIIAAQFSHHKQTTKHKQRKQRPLSEKEKKKLRYTKRTPKELEQKRYETIQVARVTKSSLPGTTLQNIRVPCFRDHTQALWDTPGLVLDPSLKHYPIFEFRRIKAMKPTRVQPVWHTVDRKSFALCVAEDTSMYEEKFEIEGTNDVLPLVRVEVRLKKPNRRRGGRRQDTTSKEEEHPKPVRLVWNSILHNVLTTNITSIEEWHVSKEKRAEELQRAEQKEKEMASEIITDMISEDLAKLKEQKDDIMISEDLPKIKGDIDVISKEVAQIKEEKQISSERSRKDESMNQYMLQKKEQYKQHLLDRQKRLASLSMVSEDIVPAGKAREINIEHFGSLGIVSPSTDALVRVYAPNTGIRCTCHPPMVVPPQWKRIVRPEGGKTKGGLALDKEDEWGFRDDGMGNVTWDGGSGRTDGQQHRQHWTEHSGEKIGWIFHDKPQLRKGKWIDGWHKMTNEDRR